MVVTVPISELVGSDLSKSLTDDGSKVAAQSLDKMKAPLIPGFGQDPSTPIGNEIGMSWSEIVEEEQNLILLWLLTQTSRFLSGSLLSGGKEGGETVIGVGEEAAGALVEAEQ
ncbi:hypothetical protein CsSME_00053115 [Camellia sinensis var. sinensis]